MDSNNKTDLLIQGKILIKNCELKYEDNKIYFINGIPSNSIFTRQLSISDNNIPYIEKDRIIDLCLNNDNNTIIGKVYDNNDAKHNLELKLIFHNSIPDLLKKSLI